MTHDKHQPTLPPLSSIRDILVVCTGNMCRSPMAAAQLRVALLDAGIRGVRVHSAGTFAESGAPASPKAITVAAEYHLDISYHRTTPLSADLIEKADLILVMERKHLETILKQAPEAKPKVFMLSHFAEGTEKGRDVLDPIGTSAIFYEKVLISIQMMVYNLAEMLMAQKNQE